MHVGCPAIDSPANSLPSSFFKRLLELIEETMNASPDQQHFRSSYKVVPFEAVKTVLGKIWYPHSFFLVDGPWHASSKAGGVGSVACGDLAATSGLCKFSSAESVMLVGLSYKSHTPYGPPLPRTTT